MPFMYNHVALAGNLTRKPELRKTPRQPVAHFSIAINRRWRGNDGELQDEVTFIECEAWGKTAEFVERYFDKGRPIFVTGRLRLDNWEDKDGQRRSRLKVVCQQVQFVDGRRRQEHDGDDDEAQPAPQPAAAASRRLADGGAQLDDSFEYPVEDPPF